MSDENSRGDGASGPEPEERDASRVDVPSETGPELDRLPPPVFPPGSRRDVPIRRARTASTQKGAESEFPDGAFISPDDPIRARRRHEEGVPDDAFISPDEPIVRSEEPEPPGDEEVEVTGIGDQEYARGEDPSGSKSRRRGRNKAWEEVDTGEVAQMLQELAEGLEERGSTALLVTSEMTRFESMLRGFLAGYLVGRGD